MSEHTIEMNVLKVQVEGYPALAALQGTYPQLGIYRRFATLNARNLLYLQAELVNLERDLEEYTEKDCRSEDARRRLCNKNWHYLSKKEQGLAGSQWHTMLRIKEKLKEYNDCLLQQRQLTSFHEPEAGNLEFLNEWLRDPRHGKSALEGLDRQVWKDGRDLLVAKPDGLADDSLTRILRKYLTFPFHILWSRYRSPVDVENGIYKYDEEAVIRLANVIGMAVSALLPVLAVVVLYFVHDMLKRLAMVAMFTVIFSLALMATTKARRIEIFAATAAFASVQVVFIGSSST
ncbi:hypothetical protein HYALB_00009358 [Hymenoscyphus albidus]|uniref:DUF6594 domain-containing protein n=1 Tax=Hymenoscyphus albidus TaxID=595503 RepID=A0A9N9LRC5_9HELO|nr:hypothetical protein HYALB_00009358 [Hymenoscyphus albidus]